MAQCCKESEANYLVQDVHLCRWYVVQDVYRWFLSANGDHFFCLDKKGELAPSSGYSSEGIGFRTLKNQEKGSVPIYRLYQAVGGHHYTTDEGEKNQLVNCGGWSFEGNIGYVFKTPTAGNVPIHRYYNGGVNKHFFTVYPDREQLAGWTYESVIGYGWVPN